LVSPILVLWGFDPRRFWRSLGVIVLASVWAGISRINWIPVPGMLGAMIYFLEVRPRSQNVLRYLLPPALWTLAGSLVALASQAAYVFLSGNTAEEFGSSFTSQLLWYRLLPSPTFPLGVLPAITLVALPPCLLILHHVRGRWTDYHPIRLLGLGAILFLLFAGGVVVSTKIGGGSNLHNLDAFLLLLLIAGSAVYFGGITPESDQNPRSEGPPWWLTAVLITVPVSFALASGEPAAYPDPAQGEAVVDAIRPYIEDATAGGGEVLFISERQLLTFGELEGVPLVSDYEKVFLMEMAMSGNQRYLETFHDHLQDHRFDLIVSHPLKIQYQGRSHAFGEENDAWVKNVSTFVLCHYRPLTTFEDVPVQLLVPREQSGECS
jgi:hypothetical protein